jgi:hypothetical protein
MGLPIADLRDMGQAGGNFMTGTFGKMLGGAAGLLLIIKLVTETFYFVPVGHRGVKLRGGHPIPKKNGVRTLAVGRAFLAARLYTLAWIFLCFAQWRKGRQVGTYKTKRGGIGMKIPFYHTVEKVNIQERTQVLRQTTVDCPDGQRKFDAELITRIPCELDGAEYADYPARVVITSSEPDQIFESYARKALRKILKVATANQRDDDEWLTDGINKKAGKKFDRVGYMLLDANLCEDPLTPSAVVARYFSPKWDLYHPEGSVEPELPVQNGNVYELPHPAALAAAGLDLEAESS